MSRRRPYIPLRRPIYIGCEGDSELEYMSFLQSHVRAMNLPIHMVAEVVSGGDPLSRVEHVVQRLDHLRRTRVAPPERYLFLDTDQTLESPQRAEQARRLAERNNINLIWQEPCFEAFLLRHFSGYETRRPMDKNTIARTLRRVWVDYQKPASKIELSRHIHIQDVLRASSVEPGLRDFLICLGLMQN